MGAKFWATDIGAAADYCKREFPNRAALSLSIAQDVCQNRFLFRDHWEMECTNVPVRFLEAVDWCHIPAGDPEWLYAMNRHSGFVNLGKAWRYSGEERFAEKFVALIRHWIENCPLTPESESTTWRSLEAGLRCESWLRSLRLFENSPLLTRSVREMIEGALLVHGDYLERKSDDFHRLSNWGVLQDHGLYLLGVYFGREDWRALSAARLSEQLHHQVFSDGTHWEQSPMYHCEVLHCAADVVQIARQNGYPLPAGIQEAVHRMQTALANLLTPDGRLLCQSDSDDTDARDMVAQGALQFSDGYLRAVAGERLFEENIWDFGVEGAAAFAALQPVLPSSQSVALPDSGNYMLWGENTRDSLFLHMHCGCLGSGHGHADLLHLDLTVCGEDALIDSGRYTYVNTPLRRQLKLPGAHNTVVVDGEDFSQCVDSWGYNKLARPLKGEYRFTKRADAVCGHHLGYIDLPGGGLVASRYVVLLKPDITLVLDHFFGTGEHRYSQYFHLGEGSATLFGNTLQWKGTSGELRLCALCENVTAALKRAPYSKDYNALSEGDVLEIRSSAVGSHTLVTAIQAGEKDQLLPFSAALVPLSTTRLGREIPSAEGVGVKVSVGDRHYTVLCCFGEVISEVDLLLGNGRSGYGKLQVFYDEESLGETLLW